MPVISYSLAHRSHLYLLMKTLYRRWILYALLCVISFVFSFFFRISILRFATVVLFIHSSFSPQPQTCIVSIFSGGQIHVVPSLNPIRTSHRLAIFESREPRRRSDCGTPPGSKRGGAMRSESGVGIYFRRQRTCKRVKCWGCRCHGGGTVPVRQNRVQR